jgi:hypothetical protein
LQRKLETNFFSLKNELKRFEKGIYKKMAVDVKNIGNL